MNNIDKNMLKYGIKCSVCHNYKVKVFRKFIHCTICGASHELNETVKMHFQHLKLLDSNTVYKRNEIRMHIGVRVTDYQFRQVLELYFKKIDHGLYQFIC